MNCDHCGDVCYTKSFNQADKIFCCSGCKSVYNILSSNGLEKYYAIEEAPGVSKNTKSTFDAKVLENEKVAAELIQFKNNQLTILSLYLPAIHCSSCIWLLEHLHQLNEAVSESKVDFLQKTAQITFNHNLASLEEVLSLLDNIGYTPDLLKSIELKEDKKTYQGVARKLIFQIAIAGFCFGNIMLLSIPEYVDTLNSIDASFQFLFRYLAFFLSIPVVLYSASDYFKRALSGLKIKRLNIDIPIVIGIIALFIRSIVDVIIYNTPGYFDSLAGLIFFLLLGKWFQERTYNSLSFNRDYKSFFPLAFKILEGNEIKYKTMEEVSKGDTAIVRNGEVIPADSELLSQKAYVDYSFVTGESNAIPIYKHNKVFAGGQVIGESITLKLIKDVSNSYLVQLWNKHESASDVASLDVSPLITTISKYFTISIILLASIGAILWSVFGHPEYSMHVFTSVLIIACPCALTLAFPFTFGHTIKFFGDIQVFFKNINVVERLAKVDSIIFDKTGTLTDASKAKTLYHGVPLSNDDLAHVKLITSNSTHPLSVIVSNSIELNLNSNSSMKRFKEIEGKGILAEIEGVAFLMGSKSFLAEEGIHFTGEQQLNASVHLSIGGTYIGCFEVQNNYRTGIFDMLKEVQQNYACYLLSGDNNLEEERLKQNLGEDAIILFNQKPFDKLKYVEELQRQGKTVCMIGDGLNDAGALNQANVGISVIDNVGAFAPASDIILLGSKLPQLKEIIDLSKSAVRLLKMGLFISILYNIVGVGIALSGILSPLIAAVLMPLSSITVVVFVVAGVKLLTLKSRLS